MCTIYIWAYMQWLKAWIMLSIQKITIHWITWFILSKLIDWWIAVYLGDSIIHPLNNGALVDSTVLTSL